MARKKPARKEAQSKSVYAPSAVTQPVNSHTLAVLVDNEPGVLARVLAKPLDDRLGDTGRGEFSRRIASSDA